MITGKYGGDDYRIENLSSKEIAKVGFLVKRGEGLQWYGGIRLIDRKGQIIAQMKWCDTKFTNDWIEQYIGEGRYLAGFHGKVHDYYGYIMQIGMITGRKSKN